MIFGVLEYFPLGGTCLDQPSRTNEIFDIIVDYPDSAPALQDLKVAHNYDLATPRLNYIYRRNVCIEWTNEQNSLKLYGRRTLQSCLISVFSSCSRNKRRLLHPGADTKDILTQYVSIIRCLRIIDPPGVLLHKVADPIRRYLRYVTSLWL